MLDQFKKVLGSYFNQLLREIIQICRVFEIEGFYSHTSKESYKA